MTITSPADWDPRSADVLRDQRAAYDALRESCPVAYSELMQWSVFRHEDITRVLLDPATFSNAVSQHVSVPNGMDPPEHTHYRQVVEPYFSAERLAAFEPICRRIAAEILQPVLADEVELMTAVALPFAARVQCAFLGWPTVLQDDLIGWTKRNTEATRQQDRPALSQLAAEFRQLVDEILLSRMKSDAAAAIDITAALMREKVREHPLSKAELASILRNWTVGEVGTISAAVGILFQFLAEHPDVLQLLRSQPESLIPAIDEILRIHGPLVANRRIATCAVELGGRKLEAGARLTLIWIAANRDHRVFPEPDHFRLDRNSTKNLLFGAGIHACPAAPLARMVLRVLLEETLQRVEAIELVATRPPVNAQYPASGFHSLPVVLREKPPAAQ